MIDSHGQLMNHPAAIERFETLRIGWHRRSAILLDAAGCPVWLVRRRCPEADWGAVFVHLIPDSELDELQRRIADGERIGWGTVLDALGVARGLWGWEEEEE